LPLASLQPAPYNPRQKLRPGQPAFQKLAASLRDFGLVEPLVWNETTGHIVGGHARLEILRTMGVTEVAVSVVRLTPAREKALNIVLNNREAQGRSDTGRLADLLTELEELPELDMTGFDRGDLASLRMEPAAAPVSEPAATGAVEVTLVMDTQTYEQLARRLDALIGEFDLVSHVRHG
jgi:ParB-like chromosome segregation protein Spo0J